MKYNVGDKVKIRQDLVVNRNYGGDTYLEEMDDIAKDNDYILTIGKCDYRIGEYVMDEDERDDPWYWTDAMIEGLAEKKEIKIKNMKYKIGDKVKIRKGLVAGKTYGDNSYVGVMDEIVRKHDYVLTIESYSFDNTQYHMEECAYYNWTDEMIEGLAEENKELRKFEAFLREAVNQKSFKHSHVWSLIGDLTYSSGSTDETIDKIVAELVEFYKTFEPNTKKKLTMDELRDIVGEDFEIVG